MSSVFVQVIPSPSHILQNGMGRFEGEERPNYEYSKDGVRKPVF